MSAECCNDELKKDLCVLRSSFIIHHSSLSVQHSSSLLAVRRGLGLKGLNRVLHEH